LADTVFTSPGTVLSNDSDPDGDALSIVGYQSTTEAGGMVGMSPDGTFTYTPFAGFTGTDHFTYTVADFIGAQDSAVVSVAVTEFIQPALLCRGAALRGLRRPHQDHLGWWRA
jgi:hypothetical protein